MPDAVVIGAGHNGLVAANLLADAGWDVVVLEASAAPGGAVRSDESVRPGYVTDLFSAFYPLAVASPVLAALALGEYGLRWAHAPAVLSHVLPDGRAVTLYRDLDRTADSVERFAAGDGAAWRALSAEFERVRAPLLDALCTPFPPVRAGVRLLRAAGAADALRLARFALTPVRRGGGERFAGEGAQLLLAGNAAHTDLSPLTAGSTAFGWLLAMLGQSSGFPVPVGGAGRLTDALVARLRARGGEVRTNAPVARISIGSGADGVLLADGERVPAHRAVLADVDAPRLYRDLVGLDRLPARLRTDLDAFEWDHATLKINWALREPIAWQAAEVRAAGTVHLGVDLDGLTRYAADLSTNTIPARPFVLLGQMTTADPTRSPAGTESAWAYTHLPVRHAPFGADLVAQQVARVEELLERHAPGFRASVLARSVQSPTDLGAADANLRSGAINGGTAALHQQLVFRPIPGLGRSETPIDRLYLAGASAHPGGGVHGAPGANAARAALARDTTRGRLGTAAVRQLHRRIYG